MVIWKKWAAIVIFNHLRSFLSGPQEQISGLLLFKGEAGSGNAIHNRLFQGVKVHPLLYILHIFDSKMPIVHNAILLLEASRRRI